MRESRTFVPFLRSYPGRKSSFAAPNPEHAYFGASVRSTDLRRDSRDLGDGTLGRPLVQNFVPVQPTFGPEPFYGRASQLGRPIRKSEVTISFFITVNPLNRVL